MLIEEKFKQFYMGTYQAVADIEMYKVFNFVQCSGLLIKANIDKPEGRYNERCSLAYLSMIYKELVGPPDLSAYVEDLEQYYGLPKGVVSNYYRELLWDLGSDNVQNMFEVLKNLDLKGDELPVFFDRLLNFVTANFGKKYGDGGANPMLARIMGKLANAEPSMTLYDPFCGTGRTIIEADNDCHLIMQDADTTMLAVAAVNAVVHGKRPELISARDTFLNPVEADTRFDRIVSEPPMAMKFRMDFAYRVSETYGFPPELVNGDTAGIVVALEKSKADGISVVLVPMSILFKSGRTEDFRRYLVQFGHLDCVISLPSGVLPHTGTASALLVINKTKKEEGVFFIDSTEMWTRSRAVDVAYLTENALSDLINLYTDRRETEASTYVEKDVILKGEIKLTPGAYLVKDIEIEVEDTGTLIKRSADLYKRFLEVNEELEKLRGGTFDD